MKLKLLNTLLFTASSVAWAKAHLTEQGDSLLNIHAVCGALLLVNTLHFKWLLSVLL